MVDTESIGTRLRREILNRGYKNLTTFADAAGIPYRTLQDYVADKRIPGGAVLARMAEVGIDVAWVLTGRPPGSISVDAAVDALSGGDPWRSTLIRAALGAPAP